MTKLIAACGAVAVGLAFWASPAAAAQYQPDAMIKVGDGPYNSNNYYSTSPLEQQAEAVLEAGEQATFKLKVQNDGNKRDRLLVKSSNHIAYIDKYFKGSENVTSDVQGSVGYKTRRLEKNEFVVLRLKVRIPADSPPLGPGGPSISVSSKGDPNVDEDAVRARVEMPT